MQAEEFEDPYVQAARDESKDWNQVMRCGRTMLHVSKHFRVIEVSADA